MLFLETDRHKGKKKETHKIPFKQLDYVQESHQGQTMTDE